MRTRFIGMVLFALGIGLGACGHNMTQRAASGAVTGAVVGGPVGAAVGATAGAATSTVRDNPHR